MRSVVMFVALVVALAACSAGGGDETTTTAEPVPWRRVVAGAREGIKRGSRGVA